MPRRTGQMWWREEARPSREARPRPPRVQNPVVGSHPLASDARLPAGPRRSTCCASSDARLIASLKSGLWSRERDAGVSKCVCPRTRHTRNARRLDRRRRDELPARWLRPRSLAAVSANLAIGDRSIELTPPCVTLLFCKEGILDLDAIRRSGHAVLCSMHCWFID